MTDINKVRDELIGKLIAENCGDSYDGGDPEYTARRKCRIDGIKIGAKLSWDQAIAHLSKQSVAFDPSNSWPVLMKVCKSLGINPASETYNDLSALLERQHQQTALIYEAKLAIANNLIRACAGFVYNHDNVGITKADVKEYINALDKESK